MHTLRESELGGVTNGISGSVKFMEKSNTNNGHINNGQSNSKDSSSETKIKIEETEEEEEAASTEGELDIILNNVVCNFSVRCHLNLKHIATNGYNVEFHKEMAMLIMKFRNPRCTASIWSSGKITMTGATTEADAKVGARRCARILQKLGYKVKFTNFRIVNVLATCTMPFAIKIADFSQAHPRIASYEPELHPGVTYKIADIRATLKIFSTGSITITAPSVESIQTAVEQAYSLVFDYKNERRRDDIEQYPLRERKKRKRELKLRKDKEKENNKKQATNSRKRAKHNNYDANFINDALEEAEELIIDEESSSVPVFKSPVDESEDEDEEEDFDSDASHD